MRLTFLAFIICFCIASCKKDKFSTVPQIEFKSISPNVFYRSNLDPFAGPFLTIQLRDSEGDFGFKDKDSSYVYVRNLTIPPFDLDSLPFPDLSSVKTDNLNAEITVNLNNALETSDPGTPHTDTLFFEVYVVDFKKNKSNVIRTEPLFYITQ